MKKIVAILALVALGITFSAAVVAQQVTFPPTDAQPTYQQVPQALPAPGGPATYNQQPAGPWNPGGPQHTTGYSQPFSAKQQEYVKVAREIAVLLAEEELTREVEAGKARISELRARKKLREAKASLDELLKKFPNSEAAKEAARMLGKTDNGVNGALEDFDSIDFGAGINSDAGVTGSIIIDDQGE